MTLDSGDGPSREYRARVAFTIGGLAILFLVLLFSGILQTAQGLVAVSGVLLAPVALLGTAWGLSDERPWAVAVATPMLWLLAIAGAIETVMALTNNTINIPIGALLAIWALLAPMRTPVDPATGPPAWGTAGTLAFVALLMSAFWPLVGALLV